MRSRCRMMFAAIVVIGTVAAYAQNSARVSLDDFVELSQRLLGGAKLDGETAQMFLAALNADAGTAVTLEYVIQSNGNPTPEQRALSAMIIEWWRTGVYEVNGEPRLAARSRAMWTAYRPALESGLAPQ